MIFLLIILGIAVFWLVLSSLYCLLKSFTWVIFTEKWLWKHFPVQVSELPRIFSSIQSWSGQMSCLACQHIKEDKIPPRCVPLLVEGSRFLIKQEANFMEEWNFIFMFFLFLFCYFYTVLRELLLDKNSHISRQVDNCFWDSLSLSAV